MSPERVSRVYSTSSGSSSSLSKPYSRSALASPATSTYGVLLPVMDSTSALLALDGNGIGSGDNTSSSSSSSSPIVERPGFPTYAQYKQIETGYIESLTPRRQGKALISQSMFDRIWDVLHHPESQLETAQFRFWARKMFTINKNYRITLGVAEGQVSPPQEVLLHDNLLVAIQEQLYDLLCYCHGSTGHGGRDKTCALIRKHYTWVPKDLVSNFIKACPTCIMKKCGNMDVTNSQIPQLMAEADKMSSQSSASIHAASSARLVSSSVSAGLHHRSSLTHEGTGGTRSGRRRIPTLGDQNEPISTGPLLGYSDGGNVYMKMSASSFVSGLPNLPNLQDTTSLVSNPWSLIGSGHPGSHHPGLTLAPLMSLEHDPSTRDNSSSGAGHGMTGSISMQQQHPPSHHSSPHLGGSHQFSYHQPMVREVSLYKGLPNGWQYRHDDFEAAHAEFMDTKRQWDSSSTVADVELRGFRDTSASAYGTHHGARVPDIAGLWGPDQFRGMVKEEEEEDLSHHQHHIADPMEYPMPPAMMRHMDLSDSCLPPALRDFHQSIGSPGLDVPSQGEYMPPIDPALLGLSSGGMNAETGEGDVESFSEQGQPSTDHNDLYGPGSAAEEATTDVGLSASSTVTSLSSRRAQVLPRLDLSFVYTQDPESTNEEGAPSAHNVPSGVRVSPTSSVNSTSTNASDAPTPLDTPVDLVPGKELGKAGEAFEGAETATVKLEAMSVIAGSGGMEEEAGLTANVGPAISAF